MKNILIILFSFGITCPLIARDDIIAQKLSTELCNRIQPIIEQFALDLTDREIQAYLSALNYGNEDIRIKEILLPSKNKWENSLLPSIREAATKLSQEMVLLDTTKSLDDWRLACLLLSYCIIYNCLYNYAITKNIESCYLNAFHDASISLPKPDAFNAEMVTQLQKKSTEKQLQNYAPSSTSSLL